MNATHFNKVHHKCLPINVCIMQAKSALSIEYCLPNHGSSDCSSFIEEVLDSKINMFKLKFWSLN